ncbi:glutamate-5-semialdehyde dehydrogenase [Leptolyngbya sp. FACHB-261]|uniref:glutamate-5-semialdehyde dehydrogenase n=1 Tax=Leptolyngbya sp. FACHB-261 TaxID=2692806 RepID=UPI001687BFC4|nr:glutamate-5-semialdehyde dehydrogenase [Leptolyngbya sp. FACHB-261]MBD2101507.1 glutamate-5-semialdehyde dehydrogenase [Leptolyngbya sp. FACHB-261]
MTLSTPASRSLLETARSVRSAASDLSTLPIESRNQALDRIAQALEASADAILAANAADLKAATPLVESGEMSRALYGRLKLDPGKLAGMIAGVRDVTKLADPIGQVQIHRELDTGLVLKRLTVPLGVVGVIFEARPDAVTQIAALAIKSGNGLLLKGGKEAVRSCEAIVQVIHQALAESQVPAAAVQLLTTREEIQTLLSLDQYVDLIIPRGSNAFVRYIQNNTHIPVLGHAEGLCHLYIDAQANVQQAVEITVDAKVQYPAACNAIETLLVHRGIAPAFLAPAVAALQAQNVEVRGCEQSRALVPTLLPATEADWATEYSDLILAVKVVDSLDEAMEHINTYGSRHTEAIVTEDSTAAQTFLARIDAAGVFHNCSTRFADGFRYGFGAEVGISTQKLPPRGPVGLEGLVTYRYQLIGQGHTVAPYTGGTPRPFTHRDLPLE